MSDRPCRLLAREVWRGIGAKGGEGPELVKKGRTRLPNAPFKQFEQLLDAQSNEELEVRSLLWISGDALDY